MEPNYTYGVRIPDAMRLELGAIIAHRFMEPYTHFENPTDPLVETHSGFAQEACTVWLKQLGFDQVEWSQPQDDILLLLLWRAGRVEQDTPRTQLGSMVDEFILAFTGHDDLIVGLFNFIVERRV